MLEEDYKNVWRQHFPTYHFSDRDIAIEEYKVAAKNLESEERIFINASNYIAAITTALGTLLIASSNKLVLIFDNVISSGIVVIVLLAVIIGFYFVSLKYFSDRHKSVIFAGRKVVILRRMLGLSYGHVQLILPNWRVEGADQPLALSVFPGWLTSATYPFWVMSIISTSVIIFLSALFLSKIPEFVPQNLISEVVFVLFLMWTSFSMMYYRYLLLDTHETLRLIFYKNLSNLIKLPLASNVEYVIYRAKLACYETDRMKISTENIRKFLVFIEDKDFHKHSGISYRSLLRSMLGVLGFRSKSGGSTIAQQLVRTLFIADLNKTIRRKLIELGLAPWVTTVLQKDLILDMYISSVRYERGCFGVVAAMKYYWGQIVERPDNAQAFFLIERVSNIRSMLLVNKIIETARSARDCGLLESSDCKCLYDLYQNAVKNGTIKAKKSDLQKLSSSLVL